VPQPEWDAVAAYRLNAVWLMGVWERSPKGVAIANQNLPFLSAGRSGTIPLADELRNIS